MGKKHRTEYRELAPREGRTHELRPRWTRRIILSFVLGSAMATGACFVLWRYHPSAVFAHGALTTNVRTADRTVAQLMALSDAELERTDILEMNIAVAKEISGLERLEYEHYRRIVDGWAEQFRQWLPTTEDGFHDRPAYYKNDIHFFRIGMLALFLSKSVGVAYVEDQKQSQIADRKAGRETPMYYTNPGHLLLHGLIDTRRGTCGNMSTLHVAMARRLGWPVALACANSHFVSRYDDGKAAYNIEMTHTDAGAFYSDNDAWYMQKENISQKAVDCGSDLRKLTGREMLGVFIALRGRYYNDTDRLELAARDYALAYALMPTNRKVYEGLLGTLMDSGDRLFDVNEHGHPISTVPYLERKYRPPTAQGIMPPPPVNRPDPIEDAYQRSLINRARMKARTQPPPSAQSPRYPLPPQPYPQRNPYGPNP